MITFERNRHSVPASFANRRVHLHVCSERLMVMSKGQKLCEHTRIIGGFHRKPGAVRNDAPFTQMPEAFRQLQDHMLRKEGGDREMVDILSLVLQRNEGIVLCAVEGTLQAGVPSKTPILNLLHRLIDRKPADHPKVDLPDALALQTTPEANVDRYDGLRRTGEKRVTPQVCRLFGNGGVIARQEPQSSSCCAVSSAMAWQIRSKTLSLNAHQRSRQRPRCDLNCSRARSLNARCDQSHAT